MVPIHPQFLSYSNTDHDFWHMSFTLPPRAKSNLFVLSPMIHGDDFRLLSEKLSIARSL